MSGERVLRLPKWAQRMLNEKDRSIDDLAGELERTRAAHALLFDNRGWFAIQGPASNEADGCGGYGLFYLSSDGAHRACTLRVGDVLLVGRRASGNRGGQ